MAKRCRQEFRKDPSLVEHRQRNIARVYTVWEDKPTLFAFQAATAGGLRREPSCIEFVTINEVLRSDGVFPHFFTEIFWCNMSTYFEQNQHRKAHRLDIPVIAVIEGQRMQVKDWSINGFRSPLPQQNPKTQQPISLQEGWEGSIYLLLPMQETTIAVPLKVRLVGLYSASEGGFEFLDANGSKRAALSSYIRAALTGKLNDYDGLVQDLGSNPAGLPANDPLEPAPRKPLIRSLHARIAVYVFVVAVLAGLGLWLSGFALGRFSSDSAYITSPLVQCAPLVSGVLRDVNVSHGEHVETDQLLFVLEDKQLEQQVAASTIRVERLKQQVQLAKSRLTEEHTAYNLYQDAAKRDIQDSRSKLRKVEAQLEYARREAERSRELLEQRVISRSTYEADMSKVKGLEAEKKGLEEDVVFGHSNIKASQKGKYLSNGKAQGDIISLKEQVQIQILALRQAELELEEAKQHLADSRVVAPVAGTVYDVKFAKGNYVRRGAPVVRLLPDRGDKEITAWFSPTRVRYLQLGMDVSVFLTSKREYVAGVVENIGLAEQKNKSDAPRRVPVIIKLPSQESMLPGSAAMVFVKSSLLDMLRVRFGIDL